MQPDQLDSLMQALQARISVLYARLRATPGAPALSQADDGRAIWTLHTLSSAYAALSQLNCAAAPQAAQVFEQLRLLAGGLMSVARPEQRFGLPELAPGDPGIAFARIDRQIRALLASAPGHDAAATPMVTP